MPNITSERIADNSPYTVKEFCRRNRISPTTFHKLRGLGQGPRELRVFAKILITPEAEAAWRQARQDNVDNAQIDRLRVRGRKGVAKRRQHRGGA